MIRDGWIEPERGYKDCIFDIFKGPTFTRGADPAGEPEAKAIVDALASKGFFPLMKSSDYLPDMSQLLWLQRGLDSTAPISLLRHIATVIGPCGVHWHLNDLSRVVHCEMLAKNWREIK